MDSFLKKSFSLGLVVACALTSNAFAASKGIINADDVNIRTQASTSSDVLKRLSTGVTVTVTANADGWYKLSTASGGTAYVKEDFVTITQADAVVTDAFVNVRVEPSMTSTVIGVVSEGESISVTGCVGDDWYSVDYNGQKGYIYGDYFDGDLVPMLQGTTAKVEKTAKVTDEDEDDTDDEAFETAADQEKPDDGIYALVVSTSLNLRTEPNTDSDVIACYPDNYAFGIVGVADGGWLKVSDENNNIGYVKAEFVEFRNGAKPENTTVKTDAARRAPVAFDNEAPASAKAAELIDYAKQFIGTPYVYGGTSLTAGVDCSGFIYSVYGDFGIALDRTSREQIHDGEFVPKDELVPGDLVFFNTGGDSEISHVGMYIGNGEYIHSTNGAAQGVTISDINSDYALNTYVGAARILKD
ncbi:MAG: SH3 domain-containing protein [Firmicutes bacterium]|nr:SH3 domain-containing protein [Bacillota bacterium]